MFEVGKKYKEYTGGPVAVCLYVDKVSALMEYEGNKHRWIEVLSNRSYIFSWAEHKEPRSVGPRYIAVIEGISDMEGMLMFAAESFPSEDRVRDYYKHRKIIDVVKVEYTEKL